MCGGPHSIMLTKRSYRLRPSLNGPHCGRSRGSDGETTPIEVKGDSKKEANETFYLDLFGNSSNSLFTKNRGLGTILNDD